METAAKLPPIFQPMDAAPFLPLLPVTFPTLYTFLVFFVLQFGSTPLHGAAIFGHVAVVKRLLAAGVDPLIKDGVRKTMNCPLDSTSAVLPAPSSVGWLDSASLGENV